MLQKRERNLNIDNLLFTDPVEINKTKTPNISSVTMTIGPFVSEGSQTYLLNMEGQLHRHQFQQSRRFIFTSDPRCIVVIIIVVITVPVARWKCDRDDCFILDNSQYTRCPCQEHHMFLVHVSNTVIILQQVDGRLQVRSDPQHVDVHLQSDNVVLHETCLVCGKTTTF